MLVCAHALSCMCAGVTLRKHDTTSGVQLCKSCVHALLWKETSMATTRMHSHPPVPSRTHAPPSLQERFYFGDAVLPLFESGVPLLIERLRRLPDKDKVGLERCLSWGVHVFLVTVLWIIVAEFPGQIFDCHTIGDPCSACAMLIQI